MSPPIAGFDAQLAALEPSRKHRQWLPRARPGRARQR